MYTYTVYVHIIYIPCTVYSNYYVVRELKIIIINYNYKIIIIIIILSDLGLHQGFCRS